MFGQTSHAKKEWVDPYKVTTIYETSFKGMPIQSFTNGVPVTLNNITYNIGIPSGGAAEITSDGLKITAPTSGSAETAVAIPAGVFSRYVSKSRWARGNIGVWNRTTAFNWGSATGGFWYTGILYVSWPNYGFGNRRTRSGSNTLIGGFVWNGTDVYPSPHYLSGSNNTTADVFLTYFRTPFQVEMYYSTWNGKWPAMEDMTLGCIASTQYAGQTYNNGAGCLGLNVESLITTFGGGQTATTSASITYGGWRWTSHDPIIVR
jgi:hypothetical protein